MASQLTILSRGWKTFGQKLSIVLSPLVSIAAGVLFGAVLMIAFKKDPVAAYSALVRGSFGSAFAISNTVSRAVPLVFTGLTVALGFKAGMFNIGAEGQLIIGGLVAAWLGPMTGIPAFVHIPLVLVACGIAGMLWALLPAIFKIRTGAHEVITTLMMSFIAVQVVDLILRLYLKDPNSSSGASRAVAASSELPPLGEIAPFLPALIADVHVGIFVAIVAAIASWVLMSRTWMGYEIRAVGENPHAAELHGVSLTRVILLALLVGGILAGMAGGIQIMALQHKLYARSSVGLGFAGIAVALLANNNPLWILPSAILFGALQSGAAQLQLAADTPVELAEAIQGTIVFFVATQGFVRLGVRGWGSR